MTESSERDKKDEEATAKSKAKLGASMRVTMRELIDARKPEAGIAAAKHRLRAWQNERFARTYADLAAQPRYKAAVHFFLTELYGDKDMSARDADLERVLPLMI